MRQASLNLNWMNESLEDFRAQLSLSKSEITVQAYWTDVLGFLGYVENSGIKRALSLKPDHVIKYLGFCKEQGKSDATINRYYMALRSFCGYLKRSGRIQSDITADVTVPRNRIKSPKIPTQDEIWRLLSIPDINTENGLRDRAILELLYSSGLRATELCDLNLSDVMGCQVRVRCGKRGKIRTVPITEEAKHWIGMYVERFRDKRYDGPLFLTTYCRPMRRQLLCTLVSEYANKAGIENVTTHTLRHACATHLLDQGADIRMIQEVLGHSSIASTQRYTHLSSHKMQSMFNQYHPRKLQEGKDGRAFN